MLNKNTLTKEQLNQIIISNEQVIAALGLKTNVLFTNANKHLEKLHNISKLKFINEEEKLEIAEEVNKTKKFIEKIKIIANEVSQCKKTSDYSSEFTEIVDKKLNLLNKQVKSSEEFLKQMTNSSKLAQITKNNNERLRKLDEERDDLNHKEQAIKVGSSYAIFIAVLLLGILLAIFVSPLAGILIAVLAAPILPIINMLVLDNCLHLKTKEEKQQEIKSESKLNGKDTKYKAKKFEFRTKENEKTTNEAVKLV